MILCSSRPHSFFLFPVGLTLHRRRKAKKQKQKREKRVSRFPCSLGRLSLSSPRQPWRTPRSSTSRTLSRVCRRLFLLLKAVVQRRSDVFFFFPKSISTSFPLFFFLFLQASATSRPSSVGSWRPFVTSTSGALVSRLLIGEGMMSTTNTPPSALFDDDSLSTSFHFFPPSRFSRPQTLSTKQTPPLPFPQPSPMPSERM